MSDDLLVRELGKKKHQYWKVGDKKSGEEACELIYGNGQERVQIFVSHVSQHLLESIHLERTLTQVNG